MSQSTGTWVLVSDFTGARIFRFDKHSNPWTLVEKVSGDGSETSAGTADFGAKASEHKGALHGHGQNGKKETVERRFAHLVAHVLERGMTENAFGRLVIVAAPKLLGSSGRTSAVACRPKWLPRSRRTTSICRRASCAISCWRRFLPTRSNGRSDRPTRQNELKARPQAHERHEQGELQ